MMLGALLPYHVLADGKRDITAIAEVHKPAFNVHAEGTNLGRGLTGGSPMDDEEEHDMDALSSMYS